jgi:hypothetical protein
MADAASAYAKVNVANPAGQCPDSQFDVLTET